MVSNYITSTQSIETKVFFCLVAFIDKALKAAEREQRAPPGFTFPWKSTGVSEQLSCDLQGNC